MRRLIFGIWNHLRTQQRVSRRQSSLWTRPWLESLETRLTPAVTATGVLSGQVLVGAANTGFGGVDVDLTGTSTTGRTVSLTAQTDALGHYAFNQLLPGKYNVSSEAPTGFLPGSLPAISGITLSNGQTKSLIPMQVAGLAPDQISLADFLSSNSRIPSVPASGAGSAVNGFTLKNGAALAPQTLTAATSPTYVDLASSFLDPDTTSTVVTFNTSEGPIKVTLLDKEAPATVQNFLNYFEKNAGAGSLTNGLIHRLDNLGTVADPHRVLQGGQDNLTVDGTSHVTAITPVAAYQPIKLDFNNTTRPNAKYTLAMARAGADTATLGYFFNLDDNSSTLAGGAGGGYAVFGRVVDTTSQHNLDKFNHDYTSQTLAGNPNFSLPFPVANVPAGSTTPAPAVPNPTTYPVGAKLTDLAVVNSTSVATPTGQMTYSVSSSDPTVVTAAVGTLNGTFSPNQLQLTRLKAGTVTITVVATDKRGESMTSTFTVTAS